ncbi:MAG: hypothetical protein PHT03_08090, partial [Bacilli bacterium]|nr:hypothetical protein [Bacilli bacterium]
MKKYFYLFIIIFLFCFFGCDCFRKESELTRQQKEIYQLAVDVGFKGTFDEWLETVKGEQGLPGADGKNVELIIQEGYIKWRNEGDTVWYNLIPLESLMGEAGSDGKDVTFRVSDGYIQWQYVGDDDWKNLIAITVLTGPVGKGIVSS